MSGAVDPAAVRAVLGIRCRLRWHDWVFGGVCLGGQWTRRACLRCGRREGLRDFMWGRGQWKTDAEWERKDSAKRAALSGELAARRGKGGDDGTDG